MFDKLDRALERASKENRRLLAKIVCGLVLLLCGLPAISGVLSLLGSAVRALGSGVSVADVQAIRWNTIRGVVETVGFALATWFSWDTFKMRDEGRARLSSLMLVWALAVFAAPLVMRAQDGLAHGLSFTWFFRMIGAVIQGGFAALFPYALHRFFSSPAIESVFLGRRRAGMRPFRYRAKERRSEFEKRRPKTPDAERSKPLDRDRSELHRPRKERRSKRHEAGGRYMK